MISLKGVLQQILHKIGESLFDEELPPTQKESELADKIIGMYIKKFKICLLVINNVLKIFHTALAKRAINEHNEDLLANVQHSSSHEIGNIILFGC